MIVKFVNLSANWLGFVQLIHNCVWMVIYIVQNILGEFLLTDDETKLDALKASFKKTVADFDSSMQYFEQVKQGNISTTAEQADVLHEKFQEAAKKLMIMCC